MLAMIQGDEETYRSRSPNSFNMKPEPVQREHFLASSSSGVFHPQLSDILPANISAPATEV
jgi:hypothetical protein